ncbi:MAG TPA: hypothetical protein PKY81_11205 [bacterium]|nr:hypothetical protein [bacterium]HPN31516.1 hypothetical protein [bacterium]
MKLSDFPTASCRIKTSTYQFQKFNIFTALILFFLSGCGKTLIKPDISEIPRSKIEIVNAEYDPATKIYKTEIENIVILIRYADIDFLSEKFSYIVENNKTWDKKELYCIPFYMLQQNNENGTGDKNTNEKKYIYKTALTPFYISVKNKNDNKIQIDFEKNAVLIDDDFRQYPALSFAELQKYNLNYAYREKKNAAIIKKVMTPIFKYSGITMLTDMVSATPASKLSLFNVSIDDVTKTVTKVSNIYNYNYQYPFSENIMFKTKQIYPNVVENGFLVFMFLPSDSEKFYLIISDIITKFDEDGSPKKSVSIKLEINKNK